MASSTNKVSRIGIISEDPTDYETLKIIISKIIDTSKIGFKSKVGNGCAKVRSKCIPWAEDLNNRGCNMLLVVHDLDRRDYSELHEELSKKLSTCAITNHFVSIPVEELEAWLVADPAAIKTSLNLGRIPKFGGLPDDISSPKEKMSEAIMKCSSNEIQYQTSMNPRIAKDLNIDTIRSRSKSFTLFYEYIISQNYI